MLNVDIHVVLTIYSSARLGVDILTHSGRGNKFPWLSLLDICAMTGIKLINYPDMVTAPIKPKAPKKSKGIANLSKGHKDALLRQIRNAQKPLSFVKRTPQGRY